MDHHHPDVWLWQLIQDAVHRHSNKVLLFQHGGGFGTALLIGGMLLQLWIDAEALAAGDFTNVLSTLEMS